MTARVGKRGGIRYYYAGGNGAKIPLGNCILRARHHWTALESGKAIDDGKLLTAPDILKRAISLSKTPGIYFLLLNGEIKYVGQSGNLWRRIEEHKVYTKGFDSYSFVPCPESDLTRLEKRYIEAFAPPWNKK